MSKKKRIKCSDESVNSYGTRVLTNGINLTQFLRNPVMYYNHETWRLPIGRWENVSVENDCLVADPVFDQNDEFAKQVADKFENGFLRAASIGIYKIEESDDPNLVLPGQRWETITQSKLIEISICDIPANDNALALAFYDENDEVVNLNSGQQYLKSIKKDKMKNIAKMLNLSETATEAEIMAALQTLQNNQKTIALKIETIENERQEKEVKRIDTLINEAIRTQKINTEQKALYGGIGKTSGSEVLEQALNAINPVIPSEIVCGKYTGSTDKKFVDFTAAELADIKANQREEYIKLYADHYGFIPSL